MDNLRWILLLSGILLIVGIFAWEVFRRRHSTWDEEETAQDQSFETQGDGLFADRHQDAVTQSNISTKDEVPLRNRNVEMGDLAAVTPHEGTQAGERVRKRSPSTEPMERDDGAARAGKAGETLLIAISVMARPGRRFCGSAIREALEELGMRHGEMGIFHQYRVGERVLTHPAFSAANALEPGSFDLDAMDSLYTPGVMLFMQLPGELDETDAFDLMLATGRQLAERLDGELRDETRSSLTLQSISHMRERISEFVRRRLLTMQ